MSHIFGSGFAGLGIWTSQFRGATNQLKAGEIMVMKSEKRRAPRHQGKLAVGFEDGKGVTRDFSSTGIYFETDKSFTPGQVIEFNIVLEYADLKGPVQMKCLGKIARVEERGQKIGVAATIDSYVFESL